MIKSSCIPLNKTSVINKIDNKTTTNRKESNMVDNVKIMLESMESTSKFSVFRESLNDSLIDKLEIEVRQASNKIIDSIFSMFKFSYKPIVNESITYFDDYFQSTILVNGNPVFVVKSELSPNGQYADLDQCVLA